MDSLYFLVWWFFFLVIGVVSFPVVWFFFRNFFDSGWGLGKTAGLALITYLLFVLATTKVLPLTAPVYFLSALIFLCLNICLFAKYNALIIGAFKDKWKAILFQEILFLAGLALWSYIRGFTPDIRGLEKFMDFGFINSILNSKSLPPPDMWFAGKPLNYYWFGHLFAAVPIKLTGISPTVAYNLWLATILGMLLSGTFSIVASLLKSLSKKLGRKAFAAGVISLILVAFAGNLHTPIYLIKAGVEKYWYPDATRFIGYFPETDDKTIHEFPIYSFVVSDLHAHLLDVPFTILFLAILWSLISSSKRKPYKIVAGGIVLGLMIATNTWDFATYGLVAGLALVFSERSIVKAATSTLLMAGVGLLAAFPFLLNFSSIAEGLNFVHSRSPLWQLGVLWGFPAIMTFIFISFVLMPLKTKLKKADLFILALLVASWILILIPEVVFVKDIYIASHYRANTMFKLTYQAYIMFYLSAGYIALRVLGLMKKLTKIILLGGFSILFASLLIYPFLAVKSYYGNLKSAQGLSGETWAAKAYPGAYQTVLWLRENAHGQPVILEAPGNSYTDNNLISSYTGFPTVSGWFVHEWLWRGSATQPHERVDDITTIYTTPDVPLAKKLLSKYKVVYVVVGDFERERFPDLDEEKFLKLGKKVFSGDGYSIYLLDN